jgi:hypothetical protein
VIKLKQESQLPKIVLNAGRSIIPYGHNFSRSLHQFQTSLGHFSIGVLPLNFSSVANGFTALSALFYSFLFVIANFFLLVFIKFRICVKLANDLQRSMYSP